MWEINVITGSPHGPVLFCWLASVVVVCNAVGGGRADRRARGRSAADGPALPILHGGPVRLRPVTATPGSLTIAIQ